MNEVTRILSAIEHGDLRASEELLLLVYRELRRLAQQRLAREKPGQTRAPAPSTSRAREARMSSSRNSMPRQIWSGPGPSAARTRMPEVLSPSMAPATSIRRAVSVLRPISIRDLEHLILRRRLGHLALPRTSSFPSWTALVTSSGPNRRVRMGAISEGRSSLTMPVNPASQAPTAGPRLSTSTLVPERISCR